MVVLRSEQETGALIQLHDQDDHRSSKKRSRSSRGRSSPSRYRSRRKKSRSHRHRSRSRRRRSSVADRLPSLPPSHRGSGSQQAPLLTITDQTDLFSTPTRSHIFANPFQTPVKKGRHLGSQLLQEWYNGSQISEFIGDQAIHALVFDRLASLSIHHCQVLMNTQEEELLSIWNNSSQGSQVDLCGPGVARSFVFQLRSSLISSVNQSFDPQVAGSASPLAGALAHLAEAAGRLRRRRKSYDQDLASSEEESQFTLSTILDSYRSKHGYLRLVPSSAFGDLRRLHQLKSKADKRADHQVPFLAHSPIEEWFPCWIGADLDRDKRSLSHKTRAKDLGSKGFASFLSNVLTFLLSHLAIGQIELPSIVAYISVLCKISEERGSTSAMKYHHLLHNHVLDRIRVGERFRLDQFFSTEIDSVTRS